MPERFWKFIFRKKKTDKNQTVFIKYYKEKSLLTTAFIELAKVSSVPVQNTKFVKGKISQMFDKNTDEIYLIKDCLQNENILSWRDNKNHTFN